MRRIHTHTVWNILGELNGKNDVQIAFNIQLTESIVWYAAFFPRFWLNEKGSEFNAFYTRYNEFVMATTVYIQTPEW